ncbi:hypothetical protein TNCV_4920021 [Trichonephila clavipes]|nr:hypothetical protein TNCV_4920021 [Trichonephila clavipes]
MKQNQVVFNNESRFNLSRDDNRVSAKRPRGDSAFAFQRHTAPTADVLVRNDIAYNRRSFLILINDTMTAQWYV